MLQTVGFIGLGDIGEPMARNLCGGDYEVVVYDRLDAAVKRLVENGAKPATSCREVGERCEVIGVCVVDDASTEAVTLTARLRSTRLIAATLATSASA